MTTELDTVKKAFLSLATFRATATVCSIGHIYGGQKCTEDGYQTEQAKLKEMRANPIKWWMTLDTNQQDRALTLMHYRLES